MIDIYESRQQVTDLNQKLSELAESININLIKEEVANLTEETQSEAFWLEPEKAQKVLKELNFKKDQLATYSALKDDIDDLEVMLELIEAGEEIKEFPQSLKTTTNKVKQLRIDTLLNGEFDKNNAIISFHPGSGGTESNDWASMLLRMYSRWAESRGFKITSLDLQSGNVAGVKSATLLIEGPNAYGYLKNEKGVHRLVRISPFDSSGRRHTSFASLDVTPEVDEEINLTIDPDDLRIDTYRSSGAGGQHVNKTSSAIRITHLPTGIVVQCQNERSQHQNKETAMKMLKSKLVAIMEEEHKEKIDELKGDYGQITWGNQIRSYVFQPYTMVKDHRTEAETGNIQAVMDGQIDDFINASLINNIE